MKKKSQSSVFTQYLRMNISFALLICAVLGFGLLTFFVINLKNTYDAEQMNKLSLAVEDFSRQEDTLQDIALEIRIGEVYRPFYFRRDATYEMELLKSLSQYRGASPMVSDYFLLYRGSEAVFYPENKSYYPVFFEKNLGLTGDISGLKNQFVSVRDKDFIRFGNNLFICYNLPLNKLSQFGDAVLVFRILDESINERFSVVCGQELPPVSLWAGTKILTGQASISLPQGTDRKGSTVAVHSQNGLYTLICDIGTESVWNILRGYILTGVIVLGAFTLIMLFLAVLNARRQYRPIYRLISSLPISCGGNENELAKLEQLFKMERTVKEQNQKELINKMEENTYQRKQIKRQMLLLLLSGCWDVSLVLSPESPIYLPYSFFGMFLIKQEDGDPEALCEAIEDLSENEFVFYASPMENPNMIFVLVNAMEESLLPQAMDMMIGLDEVKGLSFELCSQEQCSSMNDWPEAFRLLLTHQENQDVADIDSMSLEKVISHIQNGETEEAVDDMDHIYLSMAKKYPSLLIRRYMYSGMMSTLRECAQREGWETNNAQLPASPLSSREEELRNALLTEVRFYCKHQSQKGPGSEVKNRVSQMVINYISRNLLSQDLSLERIADECKLSVTQVGRIVRAQTGSTYKDYVTKLRMEAAGRMLTEENLSVGETCERIGYQSASYFIKTFRQYMGMTPKNYRILGPQKTDN